MNKTLIGTLVAAWALSGCATVSYEARCATPPEKTASASSISNGTKTVRDNFVYSERLYYSSNEWVIYADRSNPELNKQTGEAHFMKGQGNIFSDHEFAAGTFEIVRGEFDISQTNPKCYSLTNGGEQAKGFLATTVQQYPLTAIDENEASFNVGYFDYYAPTRLQDEGALKLKHADSAKDLMLEASGDDYLVNGQAAKLRIDYSNALGQYLLEVTSTGDTYALVGTVRKGSEGRYFILKNNETLLAYKGPNR